MCEFENRLIAWMDGELEADEALKIERHLRLCTACSARAAEYREVSRSFAAYRGAIATRKNSRRLRWVAWSATATVAATAALVMLMLSPRVEPLPFQRPSVPNAPAMAFRIAPVNPPAPVEPPDPVLPPLPPPDGEPPQATSNRQAAAPEASRARDDR